MELDWRDLSSTIVKADEYDFWAEVNQSMVGHTGLRESTELIELGD